MRQHTEYYLSTYVQIRGISKGTRVLCWNQLSDNITICGQKSIKNQSKLQNT